VTFLSQQGQETLLLTASDPKTVGLVLGGLEDPGEGGAETQEWVMIPSRPGSAEPHCRRRSAPEIQTAGW
jgi:hypothetical protein